MSEYTEKFSKFVNSLDKNLKDDGRGDAFHAGWQSCYESVINLLEKEDNEDRSYTKNSIQLIKENI